MIVQMSGRTDCVCCTRQWFLTGLDSSSLADLFPVTTWSLRSPPEESRPIGGKSDETFCCARLPLSQRDLWFSLLLLSFRVRRWEQSQQVVKLCLRKTLSFSAVSETTGAHGAEHRQHDTPAPVSYSGTASSRMGSFFGLSSDNGVSRPRFVVGFCSFGSSPKMRRRSLLSCVSLKEKQTNGSRESPTLFPEPPLLV